MQIELYGLPTCHNCCLAKIMLEKRNIEYTYNIVSKTFTGEIPKLTIDDREYRGKEALKQIRELEWNGN